MSKRTKVSELPEFDAAPYLDSEEAVAAYLTDVFKIKVWGPINVGLVFALSEFIVAWGIAFLYSRRAARFDAMAEEINRDAAKMGARP